MSQILNFAAAVSRFLIIKQHKSYFLVTDSTQKFQAYIRNHQKTLHTVLKQENLIYFPIQYIYESRHRAGRLHRLLKMICFSASPGRLQEMTFQKLSSVPCRIAPLIFRAKTSISIIAKENGTTQHQYKTTWLRTRFSYALLPAGSEQHTQLIESFLYTTNNTRNQQPFG